jgi:hypothetical protein
MQSREKNEKRLAERADHAIPDNSADVPRGVLVFAAADCSKTRRFCHSHESPALQP